MVYFNIDNENLECIYALATDTPDNIDKNGFPYSDEVEISNIEYLKRPCIFLHDTYGVAVSEPLKELVKSFNIKCIPIRVSDSNDKIFKLISSKGPELLRIDSNNTLSKGDNSRISPNEFIFTNNDVKSDFFYPANNTLWEEPFFSYDFITAINTKCNNVISAKKFFAVSGDMSEDKMHYLLKNSSFKVGQYALMHFNLLAYQKEKFRHSIKSNQFLSAKEKFTLIKKI